VTGSSVRAPSDVTTTSRRSIVYTVNNSPSGNRSMQSAFAMRATSTKTMTPHANSNTPDESAGWRSEKRTGMVGHCGHVTY
jgi:hypothetical protein